MPLFIIMSFQVIVLTSVFIAIVCASGASDVDVDLYKNSVGRSYKSGVSAYSSDRWSECIRQFEDVLHLYKLFKSVKVNCRLQCKAGNVNPIVTQTLDDLQFYEKIIRSRICLTNCIETELKNFDLNPHVDEEILSEMKARKPYHFLQICYFQMYALPKAASAAYTYLVTSPHDKVMKENLEYYIDQPEVDKNDIVDLESEDYEVLYELGKKSYKSSNWGETVAAMEEVIVSYNSWENNCRAECEHLVDQEWSAEFVISTSNNIISLLKCRQDCQKNLKLMHFSSGTDFLADVLEYLSFCYYKLGRFEHMAKAAASYMLLNPNNEDMIENLKYYASMVDENSFTARTEISHYATRDKYEKDLLKILPF